MTTYFNQRTGDRVKIDGRSARLDSLDNWKILGEGEEGEIVNDGVLSRPTLTAPGVHDPSADVPKTNEELREENPSLEGPAVGQKLTPVEDGESAPVLKVPARGASKAEWQEYARKVEDDPERQSDIEGMTKEQLVERYGGGS
ncbi:hypothetical protein A4E84_20230 [Streptomyces qaidamensis]|uniref:Uncharacterized protein n=1 Tax=Streptomyces qaidamensis TaxID=1783515 RepID=A0A143C278_9ACTN|nr:hypothetical protein [Streptomyces qaidamensis]AMW11616.1 hypothetical protein A4E84_20230 [Streptomyces qaidamensis]